MIESRNLSEEEKREIEKGREEREKERKKIIEKIKSDLGIDDDIFKFLQHEFFIQIQYDNSYTISPEVTAEFIQKIKDNPELVEVIESLSHYSYGVWQWVFADYGFLFDYLILHNSLDKLVWIMRLHYSDKETVKNKRYRLDVLFQQVIKANIDNISKDIDSRKANKKLSTLHMKKAWYNELVRSVPFTEWFLDLRIGIEAKVQNWYSFWWNITQSYYSFYEYLNSLCFCTNNSINTAQHQKTINIFNNSVLWELKWKTLFYPFDITNSFTPGEKKQPKHKDFAYAQYPRWNFQNIDELEVDVIRDYKRLVDKAATKSFIDKFFQLRVWANYTGIESLVRITNGGYMRFMNKNLTTILFIFAGISEITYIKTFWEAAIINELRALHINYIKKNDEYNNVDLNPIFSRFRIYKHMGIISKSANLNFMERESNQIHYID